MLTTRGSEVNLQDEQQSIGLFVLVKYGIAGPLGDGLLTCPEKYWSKSNERDRFGVVASNFKPLQGG